MFKIPKECAGMTVTLIVEAQVTQGLSAIASAYLGTKSAILNYLMDQNIGIAIASMVAFFIGIGLVITSFTITSRKTFLYLGIFSIFSSIWVMSDTRLPQLYIGNQAFLFIGSFSTFMLLPIPFYLFLREVGNVKRIKMMNTFCILFVIQFLINLSLYVFYNVPFPTSIRVTHILLIITIIISIITFTKDVIVDKNKDARFIVAGFIALSVFAIVDIVRFYSYNHSTNSMFFRIGLTIFIIIFTIGIFVKNKHFVDANAELMKNTMVMNFYISTLERQNDAVVQNAKKMAIFRHDLHHITAMIATCLENGDIQGAMKLLSTIDKDVQKTWMKHPIEPFTDHKMLDATIVYYINFAKENDIEIKVQIAPIQKQNIDKTELSVVLANALENAVNACKQLPKEKHRIIKLNGKSNGDIYFLKVVNSCDDNIKFNPDTGLPISEREGHEFGTQSIHIFAKKYNIAVRFFIKDSQFYMQLLM